MNLSAADAKLTGVNSGDAAGIDVATAGDVNGDGFGDVLVGATGDDDGDPDAGAAYIVLGSSGGIADMSLRNAHGKLTGQTWYDRAGSSLSAAGDIDDDGYSDVLVGAYLEDDGGTSAGAVYLMYGF